MTLELRKFVSPEFVFGQDARLLLGQYMANFGVEKILIVTDKKIRKFQWFLDIISSLDGLELEYFIFDEITFNPKDFECHKGAVMFEEKDCDILVAIGGGSVMDCAKGIGMIVANGNHISTYEGVDQVMLPMPPLVCIPSTSGSSADVSQFAIITNTKKAYKMVHASKMLVPDLALIDPIVTLTCDLDLTIDCALDAMVHSIEAYVSNASSFITDGHALSAIEKIIVYLPKLIIDLNNLEYRRVIMEACLEAGLAFSNTSLGLVHAMAHAIGGRYDLIHGELNAMLLEHVVKFNYIAAEERYDDILKIYKKHLSFEGEDLTYWIHCFVDSIRPNEHLNTYDIPTNELYDIAQYALNDPCILTNPRHATIEDVVKIYEKIF